nr:hypothetical protein [Actinomadura formosensis]
MEASEGLLQLVPGDVLLFDVDRMEDRLVEQPALVVVAALVERVGVFQQPQADVDQAGAVGQVLIGDGEAVPESLPVAFDLAKLGLDLGLSGTAGCQLDQVVLLGVQGLEFCGELLPEQPGVMFFVGDGLVDVLANLGDEGRGEADLAIVLGDGFFYPVSADVRSGAGSVATATAEEVAVLAAVMFDDLLDDQTLGDAVLPAVAAEHGSLEVVMVNAPTLPGDRVGLQDVLDVLEKVFIHQRLVAALDLLTVVGDVAEVVPVPQYLRQPAL